MLWPDTSANGLLLLLAAYRKSPETWFAGIAIVFGLTYRVKVQKKYPEECKEANSSTILKGSDTVIGTWTGRQSSEDYLNHHCLFVCNSDNCLKKEA
jgi:hypothetical protein